MDTATRRYPPGDLRVSDADRDRALAELSEAFQAGRLTADELDDRSGRALRAKTGGDLAVLLGDLPAPQVPAPGPLVSPGGGPVRPVCRARRYGARPAMAGAVITVIVLAGLPGGPHDGRRLAALMLVLVAVILGSMLRGGRRRRHGRNWY